jgi:hypothetical protein
VLENFAHTLQEALQQDPTLKLAVITTEVGDLFPLLKEVFTNVAVKYVKHLVPPWTLDGATGFNTALRAGHGLRLDRCACDATTWPSCSTPAARPAWPRARCSATATWWPTCSSSAPGSPPR